MLLPIAPFTETAGTFVNCEGRVQSFHGVVRPLGETRPAWKVLRVLGSARRCRASTYDSIDDVRAELALAAPTSHRGCRTRPRVRESHARRSRRTGGFERIADVPIYFADALVRRAPSLQKTRDAAAPVACDEPATLLTARLATATQVRMRQGGGEAMLTVGAR